MQFVTLFAAILRTLEALEICRDKMDRRGVTRARLIATEACRAAYNGAEFVERVCEQTGLELEIIDRETEARLAAVGCGSLADPQAEGVLLFDIGGGSSEIVWLVAAIASASRARGRSRSGLRSNSAWSRSPRRSAAIDVDDDTFEAMVDAFDEELAPFVEKAMAQRAAADSICSARPAR